MTLNVQFSWQDYTTDGVQTIFPYPFYLKEKQDLAAYWEQAGTPPWHPGQALPLPLPSAFYTVTGLGNPSGGTLVTTTPLPQGRLVLRRGTPQNQLTDYLEGDAFPAESHETALDRLTVLVQDHQEILSRASLLRVETGTPHRNLRLPDPQPNTLLGWDALAAQWTLYPSGITAIPVDSASGIGRGRNTVALTPAAGASQASALVFPSGVLALAVTVWVQTSLGQSQGLTQVGIGLPGLPDVWGVLWNLTAGSVSNSGSFQVYSGSPQAAGGTVTLTAYGGTFDGTGTVYLTGHFETYTPSQALGYTFEPGSEAGSTPIPGVPAASESVAGLTRYGTEAETITGTSRLVATHPAGVKAALDTRVPAGTALSVARYASSGLPVEATPGLTTTSDGRLGVALAPEAGVALAVGGTLRVRGAYNVELIGAPDQASSFVTTSFGSQAPPTGAPGMLGTRGRGTESSPDSLQTGDVMLRVAGRGYQGATLTSTRVSQELIALETWSSTAQGAGVRWLATAIGTVVTDEKMRLEGRGNLLIGAQASDTALTKGLVLGSGTPPSTSPPDQVQIWVEDVGGVALRAGLHIRTEEGILTRIGNGILARQATHTLTTASVASPYLASADDSGKLFIASNTSAMTQVTLPPLTIGLVYECVIQATQGMRLRAQTGNFLRLGSTTGASGGAIEAAAGASTVGHYLVLKAVTTQHWQVMSAPQTWALIA